MVNGWTAIAQRAQAWILPPSCILCGDRGQPPLLDICAPCAADLPPNLAPCPLCANPLEAGADFTWPCGQCLHQPQPFDRALAPFVYDYPLDQLIHSFKYGGVLAYGRVLGTLLAYHIRTRGEPLPEVLVPVPLHSTRQRERGFNQAHELSRPLSQLLGIPIDDLLCRRKRATEDQTELKAAQRRKNVRNAFSLLRQPTVTHAALVDDVLTTGSTAGELTQLLKSNGVKRVEVWTVARATQKSF